MVCTDNILQDYVPGNKDACLVMNAAAHDCEHLPVIANEVKQSVVCMLIMPELYRPDCFIALIFRFGKKVSPRRFAMTSAPIRNDVSADLQIQHSK